jgi:hypothetical protein
VSAPLSEQLRSALAAALTRCQPATDDDVRRAVSDALSVGGHNHQPLIHERLMRAERHVPAIVRRLLDAEAQAERWQTTAASWRERYYAEAGTRWDDELPPGGEVCATCEQPVESEPCRDHNPRVLAERLRTERDEFADRVDTLTSVAKGNKRHVQVLTAELAARRELFLAEYEGDEPRLYFTLDAARDALTTARNTSDPLVPWAWHEQDGVWSQWRTDQDDRPVELLLGSVMRVALPAGLLAGEEPVGPREGDRAHIARHDFVCFAEDIEGGGSR